MAKYLKIIFLIAFLLIKHVCIAQTLSLGELIAKADKLIGEYKDKEALEILENINIDVYKNEDEAKLLSIREDENGQLYGLCWNPDERVNLSNSDLTKLHKVAVINL